MGKILVTGTGRCGTKFMSSFLKEVGFNVGHEDVFTIDGFNGFNDEVDGDVSFAIPAFPKVITKEDSLIHLVRDPLKVVQSQMIDDFWSSEDMSNPWLVFWAKYLPDVFHSPPGLARAVHFVTAWNRRCTNIKNDANIFARQQVEGPLSFQVCTMLFCEDRDICSDQELRDIYKTMSEKQINSRGSDSSITWEDIVGVRFGYELRELATVYGYID